MSSGSATPNAGVMPGARSSLLLGGVTLAAGQVVDVRLQGGSIADVGAPGTLPAADEQLDLGGYLLLPAPAEPHAHLDKALTAARVPNPTGDLLGAVEAWVPYRSRMSHEDVVRRATVAAGGDNLQDPFNSVGSGDPLDTASLLVLAGHLSPEEAFTAVSSGARTAMGLPSVRLEAGFPAELLAVRASSLREAVAVASHERVVIHDGCVVSRTSVTREFPHRRAPRSPPGVFASTQPSG